MEKTLLLLSLLALPAMAFSPGGYQPRLNLPAGTEWHYPPVTHRHRDTARPPVHQCCLFGDEARKRGYELPSYRFQY